MSICVACNRPCLNRYCSQKCINRMRTLRRMREEQIVSNCIRASRVGHGGGQLKIDGQEERVAIYAERAKDGSDLFQEGLREKIEG